MPRLAAVDAQTYWMSTKIPNDQFLLYGFAGVPADVPRAMREVRGRAQSCPELTVRVEDRGVFTYPAWVRRDVDDTQFAVHPGGTWRECLDEVVRLAERQLDASEMVWKLHVFTPVDGIPGAAGPGAVVVLQAAHALGDGIRSSALAALLLGRAGSVPAVPSPPRFRGAVLPWRAYRAARSHRRLVRDTDAGLVPPQADSRPALRTNARPAGVRSVRTLIRHRAHLSGPTVTVAVLTAVAEALAAHLRALGDDPATLGAEVPMAKTGARHAHNHFGNVSVGLYPLLPVGERRDRIAEDLAMRRRRAEHPAMLAASQAFAAVPAPLLRWGVAQFDPTLRSDTVTGNTVVSSVNRGAADLRFGDAPVVVTAGYPGLSPMMGLTHGVHGIGATVAVSVHAAESAIGDVDAYVERLDAALGH
ncbi:wax ester/triacylglycerol synthase domain-containing protein [Mycobacterium hubeiense]|uniref:wax ester/triacylglycerol synthase domain-containing protein n=1 Tax=Mycobacterium hubeiense TaxID=1867256 RepID=UPI000C7F200F|nr:wax ester/triacylglycerol synthase domain-containing protein [Mycobacterium sp. QGD 101]